MAWRIDEQLVHGELDCRSRGQVSGTLWFLGKEKPVILKLAGNPWRDVAGHRLTFTHANARGELPEGLADLQEGVVGDITASRKVKVPDVPHEEVIEAYAARKPFPWHWGNSLYLEWYSESNGRVVIESAHYRMELDDEAAWTMTPDEEIKQREANARALGGFLGRLGEAVARAGADEDKGWEHDHEDDAPRSAAEAEADADTARMELLLDRVSARCAREGLEEPEHFDRIYEEERDRLRRERGEPVEEMTPEQEAEREAAIEEANEVMEQAMEELEAEGWVDDEEEDHPLLTACQELGLRIHQDLKGSGWLPAGAPEEHPLREVQYGVQFAAAKLGGALMNAGSKGEWPPPALYAGDCLVRLKKARRHLGDALRGLDSADEESLATPVWRDGIRREVETIRLAVVRLIREVREVLGAEEE